MNPLLTRLLNFSRIGLFPVTIRHGHLRGARWSLWPHSAYWRGHYEPEVQAALARHAPLPGSAVWDLGAHFGFYSLWLARSVGSKGEIVAVEPDPASGARLEYHLRLNPWAPVRIFHCAASNQVDVVRLIQSEGEGATTSHLAYPGEKPITTATVEIWTIPLDQLAVNNNLRPPVLIKIDVEGHAAAALQGANEILRHHHPRLLISLHSPDECTGVREQLAPLGYRPTSLEDLPLSWDDTLFKTAWFSTD